MDVSSTPAAADTVEPEYRYWAFISYSHRDEPWAHWLHTNLETYRIPKSLRSRIGGQQPAGPPDRLFPMFRDRDELGGGFDLNERLQLALRQSRFLIVICSPHSATSHYVQREIEMFEALGREDRVLCLIVDGEPGGGERPEAGAPECLSPPLRTRREGDRLIPCLPLAADARKEKDGRTNAKLKIVASMLGVRFDDLKRRDERRRFRQRVRVALSLAAAVTMLAAAYLTALDTGVDGPGGRAFRGWLDRHGLSLMRPVPRDDDIQQKADALRTTLIARLQQARRDSTSYPVAFDSLRHGQQAWAHNMAVFGILSSLPQRSGGEDGRSGLRSQFSADFERAGSKAIPEFWGYLLLARQFARGADHGDLAALLERTERVLDRFRSPDEAGGWNMFLTESGQQQPDAYSTTMALMALLEARRAGLSWSGTSERRDELIRVSFDWLTRHFRATADPPGWHAGSTSMSESADGLTLQIYGRLLDAERAAGLRIPDAIAQEIPRHLARLERRPMDFPVASGEFTYDEGGPNERSEAINFLWHPWAIDCAVRWLDRKTGRPLAVEDRAAVQRVLGHLVLDLGDEAVANATRQWTFIASETLYGLSAIPPWTSPPGH